MVYLPDDAEHEHLGTTVYAPRDPALVGAGAAHHDFSRFDPVATARYLPNSAFGFLRGDNSFHGVEPMADDYERDTMVYIVRHKQAA